MIGAKVKITLFLLIIYSFANADQYESLRVYKNKNPSSVQESKQGNFMVRFRDINSFNFFAFEQKYNLKLHFCIADGICIFKPLIKDNYEELLINLKQERDLKSVEIYNKYDMKIY